MSVKHNLEQWIAQLDYDDTCDINDRQVSDLIRNYAALEDRCAALAAENAGLKESRKNLAEFIHEELDAGYPLNMSIETPATDAFLAEVRAQGVEMLLDVYRSRWISPHVEDADRFAAQLRKGVQS